MKNNEGPPGKFTVHFLGRDHLILSIWFIGFL